MKIIKKLVVLILLGIGGCVAKSKEIHPPSSHKKVLSTIAQIGSLVKEIGNGRIDSQLLVRGELNPHTYELVKGDDEKIQKADLILFNGLGLEHGASVAALLESHPKAFGVGSAVMQKFPEKILWQEGVVDPHLWMDISLWKECIDPIVEQLIQIDPDGSAFYRMQGEALKEKMEAEDRAVEAMLQAVPSNKRYLVTSHDAFRYFAKRYLAAPGERDWEERFAAPEGLAPDGQLNPVHLQNILTHLQKYQIHILFPESNVSRDSIRKIASAAEHLGFEIRLCKEALYGDSLKGSYLDAMRHNALVMSSHLVGER